MHLAARKSTPPRKWPANAGDRDRGAGFIGSNLVDRLLERGDEVHVLDDLSKGSRDNVASSADLHVGDIREPDAAFDAARPELVFHLAAQAAVVGAALVSREHAGAQVVRGLGYLQDGTSRSADCRRSHASPAAGVAFLRQRLVPAWLAYLTLAGVPLGLLDALSSAAAPFEPVGLLGLFYFLFWGLATGATLLVRRDGTRGR